MARCEVFVLPQEQPEPGFFLINFVGRINRQDSSEVTVDGSPSCNKWLFNRLTAHATIGERVIDKNQGTASVGAKRGVSVLKLQFRPARYSYSPGKGSADPMLV